MPHLTVLAGPNGAGKTTFSKVFAEKGIISTRPYNLDALDPKKAEPFMGSYGTTVKLKDKLPILHECIEVFRNKNINKH